MKKEKLTQLSRLTLLSLFFTVSFGKVDLIAQQACAINTTDFSFSANTSTTIIDNMVAVSTINVVGAGPLIADMAVMTLITHTNAADLDIVLISPSGTIVTFTTDNGGVNDNVFNGTVWDDDADPDGLVPYTTNANLTTDHTYVNLTIATPLAPEEPLAAFNGENPNGIWTLRVSDDAAANTGLINNWTLNLKTTGLIPAVVVTNHLNNTPVIIPAATANVQVSTITVAGVQNYIRNLRVTTNLTHTFCSDLDITLTSPAGTHVTLTTDNAGANDNVYNGTLWDNDANPLGNVPYTSNQGMVTDHLYTNNVTAITLTPEESFGNFFTENPNGVWTLTISDDAGLDGGMLSSWNIELSTLNNPLCEFVMPIVALNLNTSPDVCLANTTLTVPATMGACVGVMFSYRIDNGPIIPIMGTTVNVSLSLGAHLITWFSTTACGTASGVQNVTVADNTDPVITCPDDIIISLDPGACDAVVNYTVDAFDNCGLVLLGSAQNEWQVPESILAHGAGAITVAGNTLPGGFFFNLSNTTAEDIYIKSLEVRFGSAAFGAIPPVVPVSVYSSIGNTYVGQTTNAAAWNPIATNVPVTVAGPNSEFSLVPLPGNGLLLTAGVTKGIYVMGTTHSLVYNNAANSTLIPFTNLHLSLLSGVSSPGLFAPGGFGPPRTPNVIFHYALASELIAVTQIQGDTSGSTFPIGTITNCFSASDIFGNTATCCFTITIQEFATPTSTLACNDNVQVSVDDNCEAFVGTDMILEGGPYHCYDDYLITIEGYEPGFGGVLIGSEAVGEVLTVTVFDPDTGNSCWGTITVEDKIPPTIECRDVTIMCGEQPPVDPETGLPIPAPEISGYQNILYTGLNDLLELNSFTYLFDFSYLPSTPVLDADVRIQIDDHTFLPDLRISVESPTGFVQSIFNITGCTGQDWPINCIFDDEGGVITLCVDLDAGDDGRLQPLLPPGVSTPALFNLDGMNASGVWKVIIADIFALDDGHVREVGLFLNVNLPQVDPADNCGEVDLDFTDEEFGDPCFDFTIVRHWIVTDGSGNTATCDQTITVLPLVIDSIECPLAVVGVCGQSSDPEDIAVHPDFGPQYAWPTVNGNPITDENNVCNLFVGYWDKELNDCGEGVKIVRTWTILDWCTQETIECVQVLKFSDSEAPNINCPPDMTVGTDFWYCTANVSVPKPTVTDDCGSSWVLSLGASAGVIVNFGNNFVIQQMPLGDHVITWTATDECDNESSCTFTITVVDDVVPVANCDEHTIVALTNDGPFGVTLVPATVFDDGSYDNCGPPVSFRVRRMDSCIEFDWTTNGACEDHIPGGIPPVNSRDRGTVHRDCAVFACCDVGAGPIMIELEVTDASGNVNFCMVEVEVQDKITPFVECPPDIIVSCDMWFNVEEGTFYDDPEDGGNGNGNLDEDPLSPIFGNMFDAFKYDDDESVRQDIWIDDPGALPFITPQPHFWGIDGWADDNCEVNLSVRVTVISDCSGDELPNDAPPGAVKLIERRFTATDGNSVGSGVCRQRIWVVDFYPFYIDDVTCNNSDPNDGVIWPCDVHLTDCPEDLGDTGEPIIFDDACSLIGVAYEDTRFDFVDGACFKILREWTVIDWCQYGPDGEGGYFGIWYYTQVIKVHDEEGPEFLDCPDPVVLCVADEGVSLPDNNQAFLGEDNPLSSSCSVHLNLCKTVHETCADFVNFDVKIYLNNGDDFILLQSTISAPVDTNNNAELCFNTRNHPTQAIRLNGIPYNSPWCGDYHRILWSVEDGCGNWSHCEYLLRLEDCKQPSPVCINGLSTVVMPVGCIVTIWAKDFDASSFDDCTPAAELLFSFSGDSYQPSFTYTIDNVPAFNVELSTNIWVADFGTDDNCNGQISWNERNKDFCTTTIVITDNTNECDTVDPIIGGVIMTEDIQSVEKVSVTMTSPGHVFPTYVTIEDGKYIFDQNIILPNDFAINSDRNDDHRNGVSTLDLVRIQKHLLGIEAMSSPYDLIAADANNSQNVSAIDLIELRKLILGIYTELPANKSWRFVDETFQFTDPKHPWPFDEVIDITNMGTSQLDMDFVAVKVGDVNNTVQANALQILPRNGNSVVGLAADERIVSAGEMVDVAITSADFASIEGYQFTLQTTGLEFRGVEGGVVSMSDENMGVFGSTLTASWHKVGGVSAKSSDVLFTLHFQATAAGKLSQMITLNSRETKAEAYNTIADIKDLKLTFRGAEAGAEFALYQNEPNPFKGNTLIGYDLPEASNVTLTVFDVTGKVITVKEQVSVKGYNTIALTNKEIPSVGVLYYRLDANEYTATKKMIIIE